MTSDGTTGDTTSERIPVTHETCEHVSGPRVVTRDGHIALQVVDQIPSATVVRAVHVLADLLVAATGAGFAWACWSLISESQNLSTPSLGIPMPWVYALPLLGFVSTAVRATIAAALVVRYGVPASREREALTVNVNGPERRPARDRRPAPPRHPSGCWSSASRSPTPSSAPAWPTSCSPTSRSVWRCAWSPTRRRASRCWPSRCSCCWGSLANRAGIADRLFDFALALMGRVRGGLGYVSVGVSLGFSWMSGSAVADAAALSKVEIPAMERNGYTTRFGLGVVGSSALIAPVMPPSIPAVIYAGLAAVSTGALFAASVIPALLMAAGLCAVVAVLVRRQPDIVHTGFSWSRGAARPAAACSPRSAPRSSSWAASCSASSPRPRQRRSVPSTCCCWASATAR